MEQIKNGRYLLLKIQYIVKWEKNAPMRALESICSCFLVSTSTWLVSVSPSHNEDWRVADDVGVLSGLTGGEVFFHPRFDPTREGHKLTSELTGVLTRETGYSVTMRIRCSEGLRISDHFGNFFQRNVTDLEMGMVDADKAVAALVKHDAKLDEKLPAYFQCAVLYTSATGQRRVRCHNLAVGVSSKLGDVFRAADMDATIALVAKEGERQTKCRV